MNNPLLIMPVAASLTLPLNYPLLSINADKQPTPIVLNLRSFDYEVKQNATIVPLEITIDYTPSDSGSPAIISTEDVELKNTFDALAKRWKDQTAGYSSVGSMVMHPAYLEIISYGEKMIPFILEDLRIKPSHWFIALKTLAKTSPVKAEDAGNIKKMTEAWLAWGKANGKLS